MKNILKVRFLSHFVMLFLFIFGLNTALSTPALAADGSSLRINFKVPLDDTGTTYDEDSLDIDIESCEQDTTFYGGVPTTLGGYNVSSWRISEFDEYNTTVADTTSSTALCEMALELYNRLGLSEVDFVATEFSTGVPNGYKRVEFYNNSGGYVTYRDYDMSVYEGRLPTAASLGIATPNNKSFIGWRLAGDANCNIDFGVIDTSSIIVEALAECNSDTFTAHPEYADSVPVSFFPNGGSGSAPTSYTCTLNSCVLPQNTYTRAGYTFTNWLVEDGAINMPSDYYVKPGTNIVSKFTDVHTSIGVNLTAQWTANTYTVRFNSNNGTGTTKTQSFTYDVAQNLTANTFVNTGHTFLGWSRDKDATTATYTDRQSVKNLATSGEVTLYAVWQEHILNINYTSNGATSGSAPTSPVSCGGGSTCTLPANPYTKTGYTFAGWGCMGISDCDNDPTMAAGSSLWNTISVSSWGNGDAITLFPKWTVNCNAITIKGSTRGGSGTYTIYKKTGSSKVYKTSACSDSAVWTSIPDELISTVKKDNAMFAGTTNDCIKVEETGQDVVKLSFNTATTCNVTGATTWDARFYCKSYWRGSGKNMTGACTGSKVVFTYADDKNKTGTKITQTCEYGSGCSTYEIKDLYDGKVGYAAGAYLYDCADGSFAASNTCDGYNNNPIDGQIEEQTDLSWLAEDYIGTYFSDAYSYDTVKLNMTLYPYWVAVTNKLVVYESASATSAFSTNDCPYNAAASVCIPESKRPTKAGYTLIGYCQGKNDSCSNVIGVDSANLSTLATGSTTINLTAQWQLNTYEITLDSGYYASSTAGGGLPVATVASPTKIYEKYGAGWYTNSAATTAFTQLTTLPKYNKAVFGGFYTGKAGTGTQVIDASGNVSSNKTIYNTPNATTGTAYAKYTACSCVEGTNVSECSVSGTNDNNQCVYDVTCVAGYTNASNVGAVGVASNTMNCGTAAKYLLQFNGNGNDGGSVPTATSATYGLKLPSISTSAIPTKTGYIFGGWYDTNASTGGNQYYTENNIGVSGKSFDKTSNTTLYARWTPDTYTINLNHNGGTSSVSSVSVTFNQQIPATVTKPSRVGHTFDGYYTSATGGTQYYDQNGNRKYTTTWAIAAGATIYAHWTAIEYQCAASYYLPAGATKCELCKDGHYCTGGTYEFNETQDQGIGECPIGTYTVATSNVRFECTACPKGLINSSPTDTGCEACPNTNNGVTSWQQTAWSASTGVTGLCTITACKDGYTISGSGANTKCTANQYTVTLNVNGGTGGMDSVTAIYDSAMPKLTSVPTRDHYTLDGYYDTMATSGGNKYYNADGTSAKIWNKTSNTTLYARWIPDVYTITLDSFPTDAGILKVNPVEASPNKLYVKYEDGIYSDEKCINPVTKITPPTNDATAFTGFYTTATGTGNEIIAADGNFKTDLTKITSGGTLYARWSTRVTPCAAGKYLPKGTNTCASCLPGYYCEGGNYVYSSTTDQGLTGVCVGGYSTGGATESACTACNTGYVATGTSAENHDAADDCKPITYYLKYSCGTGSGNAPAQVTAKYDTGYTAAANSCTKTGYSFTGWKCTGGGTSCDGDIIQVNGSIKNITATNGTSINMTAQWSANTYQVCFNGDGGSGMPSCVTATYDEPMPSVNLDNVKRTGFTFVGIYDSADKKYYNTNGSPAVEAWDKASDTTLIAKWDADPIRCTAMYYLPANSIECKKCEAGYYCPDTDTYTYNATQAQGRKQCSQSNQYSTEGRQYCLTCPDGGVIRDVNANGLQDAASECYKEVDYVAAHGTGKQTCYYSATDSEYNLNCYDKSITTCATGYELENSTDLDCKLITYNVVYYDGSTKLTNFNSHAYQYSIEASITTLPTPQKEGYQFVGWYTNSNLTGTPVTQITSSDTGNKTLYAKYVSLAKVTLYLDAGPCTAPENKSITIYEDQLDELYTILTSDKNLPNCDNIGGTYHGFYYVDMGESDDLCMINSDGACNGLVTDGDTLYAYVTYEPIVCAAGTYLRAGWISSCTECPAGSYCSGSGATGFLWNKNTDQGIEKCPTNYTSYAGKAADKPDCYAVLEPGKYVKNAGDTTFTTCPAGSFCPGTDIINYGEAGGAKKCWSGNYCPETGMAEQTPCPAGYHCPDSGMTQPTVCSGSTYTETTGKATCDACPSGYSIASSATDYTDHDKKSDCKITCAPGYYLEPNANSCSVVGHNYYSNGGTVGYGYNLIRSECPDGGLTSTETANRSEDCYIIQECDVANGKGTQSCLYGPDGGYTDCGDCSLTSCENGFIKNASGVCIARPITIEYLCDGENVSATKTCYVTDSECRLDYDGCTKTGHTLEDWLIETTEQDIVDAYIHGDLIAHGFIAGLYDDFWEYGNQTITVTPNRWNANKITVKYQVDGKIVKTVECTYGSTCNADTDITTPTQVGGIFAGWGDENTIYAPGDALNLPESGEYLLRAEFNPIKYAIGYHQNTGVGEQIAHTLDCEYDQGCKLTTSFYTKDGSAFLGWSTDPNATTAEYKSGASVMNLTTTNGDIVTLYAIYGPCTPCSTAAGVSCKLSTETGACVYRSGCNTGYNLVSGQNTANPVCSAQELVIPIYRTEIAVEPYHTLKVFYGGGMPETVSIPDVREGYTFTGLIGDNGIIYYDNNGNRQNSNGYPSKLTAVWTANSYTVTYNANKPVGATENVSGTVEPTQHVYDEPKKVSQNTYSLRGYTSNGWNTAADASGTPIASGAVVENLTTTDGDNVLLYAQYTANTYTVKYDANGGEGDTYSQNRSYNDGLALSDNNFTRDGYSFAGWNTEPDGSGTNYSTTTVDNLTDEDNATIELYAQWTQNVFSVDIEYNCGDGSGSAPALQTCLSTDDKCLLAQASCKKDGYIFMGWMFDGGLKNAGYNVLSYATSENDDKTFEATAVYTKSEFEIKTTSTTQTFNFALAVAGTFYIDWGDGKTQVIEKTTVAEDVIEHTYADSGTYTIGLAGDATGYNTGINTSSIRFYHDTNSDVNGWKYIAGIDGSLGAMFGTLNNPENGETQPRFRNTFYNCTNLSGEIPADLFSGISGQPSRRMFQNTFSTTNLSGNIPEGLFAGIVGSVTDYLFYRTFQNCSKLTGQIPADLFAGITGELTSTTTTQLAFSGTFWNAGVGADEQGNPLTIPNGLFSGLSTTNYVSGQMANIFTGTKFATACSGGVYKVTAPENPFVADWSEKAMCNTCPSDTSRKVTTDAGNNNGINSCYAVCPTSITITNGTTTAVNTKENYDGTMYPACTYNVACNTGYDAKNNGSTKPSCAAHTYTVTYVEDTANVSVDAVFGKSFTFSRPTPVKTGYTGTGWQDVTGKTYEINEQIIYSMARDMSVTPTYKANEYSAIYDCGNGTDNVTENVAYDDDYTLKTDICTQPGRTFVGWSVDGVNVSNAFVWKYTHDVTFTARYSNNVYECEPGYYLPQGGTICNAECETGSYCPGGVFEYTGEEQGMNPCPQYSDSASGASACTCYTGFTVYGIVGGNNLTTEHACMLAPQFVVTTTAKTTSFRFNIAAKGKFWVDCGDGSAVKEIDRTKIDFDTDYISDANTAYTCKYSKPGMYEIKFAGRASGYDKTHRQEPTYSAIRFSEYYEDDTYNEGLDTIYSISGSLGSIFPTLKDGTNPTFYGTFAGQTAMTGEIPSTLFDGVHGKPVEHMFEQTFANCIGLTGDIPATLFAGLDGAAAKFTFYQTFYQCAGLTGIPSDLFKGVKGDPAYGMFSNTFRGCSGLTGSIPEDLFANVYGAPAERMFVETFMGCSGLTGPIPAGLFRGITGDAAPYMFFKTFDGCTGLTGNIPHELFRGITGAPKISMFRGTFHNCSGLTGSIPSDLFAGIKGEAATAMFVDTFYGCSGIDGYVPTDLFANITNNTGLTGTIKNIFLGTSIATQCPTDQYKVVSEFSNQWGDYVACNSCPGVGTIESDGQYGIEMCHATIPCNENGAGTKDCKYNAITSQYDVGCTECEYSACVDGYYLNNGICEICPVGSYCANSIKTECPDTYTTESTGAVLDTECFANCADKEVIYGTGYMDKPLVFLPEVCTHTYGISVTGNPCKIIDNVCVETSCNYDYEMINGKCELCVRDNALTFKSGAGNCVVESCLYGYHPFGQSCVPNTRECSIDGALSAEQKWDTKTNNFGPCMVTECAEGYHIDANTCVLDVQTCELENGMGEKVYNHDLKKWGDCVVTTCKPGYTNDPSQTNETWKQCGQCNNMFGANGERAVSSYLTECEIASCMYQGEKYILENNECVLICDERSDETGSRYWNGNKCVHECKPGFLTW